MYVVRVNKFKYLDLHDATNLKVPALYKHTYISHDQYLAKYRVGKKLFLPVCGIQTLRLISKASNYSSTEHDKSCGANISGFSCH